MPHKKRKSSVKKQKYRFYGGDEKDEKKDENEKVDFETTVIPSTKPFPITWKVITFNQLEDDQKEIVFTQIVERSMAKKHCNIFCNDEDDEVCLEYEKIDRIRKMVEDPTFLIAYDTYPGTGVVGILRMSSFPTRKDFRIWNIYENIETGKRHFMRSINWVCSFTTEHAHYKEIRVDHDISAAKFLLHEYVKQCQSMIENGALFGERVDDIVIYAASYYSARASHMKNGARPFDVQIYQNLKRLQNPPQGTIGGALSIYVPELIYWRFEL